MIQPRIGQILPSLKPTVMKMILPALLLTSLIQGALAQVPQRTPENVEKYKTICREHIQKVMKGMYREAGGSLSCPCLAPGSNQYLDMLWYRDSWLSNVALGQNSWRTEAKRMELKRFNMSRDVY